MSDSRNLLLAILAMDSYNREYDEGIVIEGDKIGSATFKNHKQSDVSEIIYTDWQSAGFYAAAYELPGETVISYRGTDDLDLSSAANDILNGWVIGAGTQTGQSALALDFYEKVTKKSVYEASDAKVVLTGHSLGGGERMRCR